MGFLLQEIKKMKYRYQVKSNNGLVSGISQNYTSAMNDANVIIKTLFPSAVLSEKLNDLVSEPDYLVYELGDDFVYLKIEKYED